MTLDKNFDNVHRLENGRKVGDRVYIKADKLEKYVRDVEAPEELIKQWRERREQAIEEGKESEFLDSVPHPKAELISAKQLFIVVKIPGKYKLAPLMSSKRNVWVDSDDVEDNPFFPKST